MKEFSKPEKAKNELMPQGMDSKLAKIARTQDKNQWISPRNDHKNDSNLLCDKTITLLMT